MLSDADGNTIATQQAGVWRGSAGLFAWIDFKSPVTVNFKNEELGQDEKFGPVPFRIINGSLWTMGDDPKLIAQFDAALSFWHMVNRPAVAMTEFTIS